MQNTLLQVQRDQLILQVIRDQGVANVRELSEACAVTEVTIRRDLQRLEERGLLQRTYGGAMLVEATPERPENVSVAPPNPNFVQEIDALIMTYARTQRGQLLLEQAQQRAIPIIAESERIDGARYVGIDPYESSYALGKWVAANAPAQLGEDLCVLDVTYYFPNARQRSEGFMDGLLTTLPSARHLLSIDGHALKSETATLVRDTLTVHPDLNLIFAINDDSALGAVEACRAVGRNPDTLWIVWVGLDGVTTRHMLSEGGYLKACIAMFPEVVAYAALSAALVTESGTTEPILTPTAILTRETLPDYYEADTWQLRPEVFARLTAPIPIPSEKKPRTTKRVGFVLPFNTHDWYRTMTNQMARFAGQRGVELAVEDATASPTAELAWLAQNIARIARIFITDGETILLDHDPICLQIARQLSGVTNLTVITNSVAILTELGGQPNIRVILSGGELHPNGEALIGRVAESVIGQYHAHKAFIGLAGISEANGLSAVDHPLGHIQQAMIAAARELYLLADHTRIGASGQAKIMPIAAGYTLISDAGIAPIDRLTFRQLGLRVVSALPE